MLATLIKFYERHAIDKTKRLEFCICGLFSPLGIFADRAIYFTFHNFFFTISKAISVSTGPIFTIFYYYACELELACKLHAKWQQTLCNFAQTCTQVYCNFVSMAAYICMQVAYATSAQNCMYAICNLHAKL